MITMNNLKEGLQSELMEIISWRIQTSIEYSSCKSSFLPAMRKIIEENILDFCDTESVLEEAIQMLDEEKHPLEVLALLEEHDLADFIVRPDQYIH